MLPLTLWGTIATPAAFWGLLALHVMRLGSFWAFSPVTNSGKLCAIGSQGFNRVKCTLQMHRQLLQALISFVGNKLAGILYKQLGK